MAHPCTGPAAAACPVSRPVFSSTLVGPRAPDSAGVRVSPSHRTFSQVPSLKILAVTRVRGSYSTAASRRRGVCDSCEETKKVKETPLSSLSSFLRNTPRARCRAWAARRRSRIVTARPRSGRRSRRFPPQRRQQASRPRAGGPASGPRPARRGQPGRAGQGRRLDRQR